MRSADSIADDIINGLKKRCQDLDLSKEQEGGSTLARFALLENNQYYFQIVLDYHADDGYCAFWFQAIQSRSSEEKSIPLLWHRDEDELYSDSYEEALARLVDEDYQTLSHRSKICVKNGLFFRSSQLHAERDGGA